MGDDSSPFAIMLDHGLVNEIKIYLSRRFGGRRLQRDLSLTTHVRFARLVDLVQQVNESLAAKLGERLCHCLADDVAVPNQIQVGVVGELEDVLAAAQHREKRRSL